MLMKYVKVYAVCDYCGVPTIVEGKVFKSKDLAKKFLKKFSSKYDAPEAEYYIDEFTLVV